MSEKNLTKDAVNEKPISGTGRFVFPESILLGELIAVLQELSKKHGDDIFVYYQCCDGCGDIRKPGSEGSGYPGPHYDEHSNVIDLNWG